MAVLAAPPLACAPEEGAGGGVRAPQRSVLVVHEQRSTAKLPFAGRQSSNDDTP